MNQPNRLTLTDALLVAVLGLGATVLLCLAWIGWAGRHAAEPTRFVGSPSHELVDELAPGPLLPITPTLVVIVETPNPSVRFDGVFVS